LGEQKRPQNTDPPPNTAGTNKTLDKKERIQ